MLEIIVNGKNIMDTKDDGSFEIYDDKLKEEFNETNSDNQKHKMEVTG